MWQDWPFFHTLLDNAQQELARTRPIIALGYDLLADVSFHAKIVEEYDKARSAVLNVLPDSTICWTTVQRSAPPSACVIHTRTCSI